MRIIFKTAIVTGARVVLLGASLALSSVGVVSSASQTRGSNHAQPAAKSCDTSKYCLTEDNKGTGGGISASGVIGVNATGGSCSICSGVYSTAAGYGVYASASNSSSSSPGYGVFGTAPSYGVYGAATGSLGTGVTGTAPHFGVYGASTSASGYGYGVEGDSLGENGLGVFGLSIAGGTSATGVWGESTSMGVVGVSDTNTGYPFVGIDSDTNNVFVVNNSGDGIFNGYVEATSFKEEVPAQSGPVSASIALAPRATIEDTGTAQLTDGVGVVHLERDFARTLDISQGYQVFLTPDGETRGWLYVAQKYEGGFIVREAEHGRSSVYFDYRIVAHPLGASDQRFPAYTPRHLAHLPKLPTHAPARPPTLPSGE